MKKLRMAFNGSTPKNEVDGDIMPGTLFTDGCPRMAEAIKQELWMCLHLLCVFHLWLNVKDCIKPVFREGRGYSTAWITFSSLFWKVAHQSDEIEANRLLQCLMSSLEAHCAMKDKHHMIHEQGDGKRGKLQSLRQRAVSQVSRLISVKQQWLRTWT